MTRFFLALVALLLPLTVHAQGMVTSADPRATEAGRQMLREGGTATDAAIAMMLALTVVEPQSSGIGGGGFLVHHDAATGRVSTVDGREKAPAAATPRLFLRPDGTRMGFLEAVAGGRSVGVPGNIRLAALAHRQWGKLQWKRLFRPAIRLAERGFTVTRPFVQRTTQLAALWQRFPDLARLYLGPDGKPLAEGARVRNPELARTLRRIADEGPDAFYSGETANAIVAQVVNHPNRGEMTVDDLTAYQARERDAVCAPYRTWRVCGMGPPSAGATTVLGILGMLERFDMKALGKDSPQAWHLIGEAMRLAYADREAYLGDPDFVAVPVAGLIERDYLARRSALISPERALGSYQAGAPPGADPRTPSPAADVSGTTHFIAVDRAGNIVSMTSTVEGPFGSQLVAGGFVLNNELTDFAFVPEVNGAPVANRVEGGKRPLSSMSPTIVYDAAGKPVFAVGAAGGRTIPMQVLKTLVAHLDWGLSAADALAQPVLYYNRDGLVVERGTALEAMRPALEALGHRVTPGSLPLKANAAERTPAGWRGAADPRSVGNALTQ